MKTASLRYSQLTLFARRNRQQYCRAPGREPAAVLLPVQVPAAPPSPSRYLASLAGLSPPLRGRESDGGPAMATPPENGMPAAAAAASSKTFARVAAQGHALPPSPAPAGPAGGRRRGARAAERGD